MNKKLIAITALLVATISINYNFSLTDVFGPPSIAGSRDQLHACNIINVTGALGPESVAFDPNGEGPYTGVADGRILKWQGHEKGWTEFAITSTSEREKYCVSPYAPEMEHVCGRPLGIKFDKKTGDLYIADAYFGLQVVRPEGGLATTLLTEAEGQPFLFTNDIDIDEQEGVIYFTDSSTLHQRRDFMSAALGGDRTGRLMKYNKSTKQVQVLLRDLAVANGVALSKARSFVLVAETIRCRILRFWLKGPNAGTSDVFAELPGFPDNIRRNSDGEFWVALHSKNGFISKLLTSNLWIGKSVLKLPLGFSRLHSIFVGGKPHATAMKFSEEGEVLQVLEDSEGKTLRFISEVEEKDGKLLMGSVSMPFIGVCNL